VDRDAPPQTTYCYGNLAPTDQVLQMEPNPLAQIINLRAQAEKASKTQREPRATQNALMDPDPSPTLIGPPLAFAQRCLIGAWAAG
jgi:hypothetical protein